MYLPSAYNTHSVNDSTDYSQSASSSYTQAIPLPDSHIHRTESELQLSEDMAIAEYRDQCMFDRLVNGIRRKQQLNYIGIQSQSHSHCRVNTEAKVHSQGSLSCDSICDQEEALFSASAANERSIESIISTRFRQQTSISAPRSHLPLHAPMTSPCEGSGFIKQGPASYVSISSSSDDDWSIEGFNENDNKDIKHDSNVNTNHVHDHDEDGASYSCSQPVDSPQYIEDQVFDIEL